MKEKLEKRQVLSDKPCSVVHILMCMGKAIVTVKLKKKKSWTLLYIVLHFCFFLFYFIPQLWIRKRWVNVDWVGDASLKMNLNGFWGIDERHQHIAMHVYVMLKHFHAWLTIIPCLSIFAFGAPPFNVPFLKSNQPRQSIITIKCYYQFSEKNITIIFI